MILFLCPGYVRTMKMFARTEYLVRIIEQLVRTAVIVLVLLL